ncbi:hypothetical protein Zm00014a_012923 [Zea mays]|uniref:Uncharacterized protein n=1 Tax=Zea mays TaxID=4577 RepID=A0A3L6EIZ5_MAIZE|nr:hypothetical protein Zm00014a_012923 [Zea mays]
MFLLLSQRILPSHVWSIAMEIADAEQMQMKPLLYFFLQISLFSHLTFLGQVYPAGIMSVWVGMRKKTSNVRCHVFGTINKFPL